MTRGEEIAARIGAARASAVAGRLAEAVRAALPDARVSRDGDAVTITARGAFSRLRWPGGLVR
ncbi:MULTISPECIES: hypothetical protein [unclassified Sphingomonas]|uniref:hypothetical protein n=1 Tax=unclassified Sphingomonas TaxID=196159 RepID=UPI000929B9DD|nr:MULTISPECIES: hypothetical protein [unclassified Sphingomonas]MBN8849465.1 hypothetical protein [Sphingomonas sp.]OJV34515.1 MAG: hypothetical protein BGO24_12655 [Sphingomonas sp. 67-36]